MKKVSTTRIIIFAAILVFIIFSLPFLNSCSPVIEFGDLIISADIDPETAAPLGLDKEFDFDVQKIYVVIKASGVDADDIKRFSLKSQETGQMILEPGEYTAEFYHKGELKDTQDFTIIAPEIEILDVVLANQIDKQTMAPINITDKFLDTDVF